MINRLFKRPIPTVTKEAAGIVRLTLILPDLTGQTEVRTFPYNVSVAIMHPDEESNWFIFILDEGEDDAFTFGVHQDRVFSLELIEGHYDTEVDYE